MFFLPSPPSWTLREQGFESKFTQSGEERFGGETDRLFFSSVTAKYVVAKTCAEQPCTFFFYLLVTDEKENLSIRASQTEKKIGADWVFFFFFFSCWVGLWFFWLIICLFIYATISFFNSNLTCFSQGVETEKLLFAAVAIFLTEKASYSARILFFSPRKKYFNKQPNWNWIIMKLNLLTNFYVIYLFL